MKNIEILMNTGEYMSDVSLVKKSNEIVDVSLSLSLLRDENENPIAMIGYAQDISSRKKIEVELDEQRKILKQQAHYDSLTGLANRVLFQDRLSQAIKKAQRNKKEIALFFIDLDRFKQINDSLGHSVGDEVLKEISLRLQLITRKDDSISRLGGDEFTIIAEDLNKGEDASLLAQKILTIFSKPLYINNHTLYVSCSIGISLYPQDSTEEEKLLMYADAAMYKAKDEGKNNFQFYSQEMTTLAFEHITIESNLRDAIANEELIVYSQPIVDIKSDNIISCEALIRWNHPTKGLIYPDNFISYAEKSDLIIEIGDWVINEVSKQFHKYNKLENISIVRC